MRTITVYCGAVRGNSDKYERQMEKLLDWITEGGHKVVYGGGKVGLMGLLADGMLARGGEVTGVIPHFLKDREIAHEGLTEMIYTADMSQRKKVMVELGDVFVAFPGGPGTLEEIVEVISWARIGEHLNPCIVYNFEGYYDALREMFDKMVEEGFLTREDREKILFSDSKEEMDDFIENYIPPKIREYEE